MKYWAFPLGLLLVVDVRPVQRDRAGRHFTRPISPVNPGQAVQERSPAHPGTRPSLLPFPNTKVSWIWIPTFGGFAASARMTEQHGHAQGREARPCTRSSRSGRS